MSACPFCANGQTTQRLHPVVFRQQSDKGYVRCEVMIMVHVCDACAMQTVDAGADQIMNEAFQREYGKLGMRE